MDSKLYILGFFHMLTFVPIQIQEICAISHDCVERLKDDFVYDPTNFGIGEQNEFRNNETYFHIELEKRVNCNIGSGKLYGWEYITVNPTNGTFLPEIEFAMYSTSGSAFSKKIATSSGLFAPEAKSGIQYKCSLTKPTVINDDTYGVAYASQYGRAGSVLRIPGLYTTDQYPCSEVINSNTSGHFGLFEYSSANLDVPQILLADLSDFTTFLNYRMELAVRPIILSQDVFVYTCGCSSDNTCSVTDINMFCSSGTCQCKEGFIFLRLQNKCTLAKIQVKAAHQINNASSSIRTGPERAVDSNVSPSFLDGTCSSTRISTDPWMILDLGAVYDIEAVSLTAPTPEVLKISFHYSALNSETVCETVAPTYTVLVDSVENLPSASGGRANAICIYGPYPWKLYSETNFGLSSDSFLANNNLLSGPTRFAKVDIFPDEKNNITSLQRIKYFGYLLNFDGDQLQGYCVINKINSTTLKTEATLVPYVDSETSKSCTSLYIEPIVNVTDEYRITILSPRGDNLRFPASADGTSGEFSLNSTAFTFLDSNDIVVTSIEQLFSDLRKIKAVQADKCLGIADGKVTLQSTCTGMNKWLLDPILKPYMPTWIVKDITTIPPEGNATDFGLTSRKPCLEVLNVTGTNAFAASIKDTSFSFGEGTVQTFKQWDGEINYDDTYDATATVRANSVGGIRNFTIDVFDILPGGRASYPLTSAVTTCTTYTGYSKPGVKMTFECTKKAPGRYIGLKSYGTNERLTLCDVEVHGQNISDVDECQINNGNCSQSCENTLGSFYCSCSDGFTLVNDSKCQDINECNTDNGNCSQLCNNTAGGSICYCYDGYELYNATYCEDINECNTDNGNCSQLCTNTAGGSNCNCYDGYELYNATYCEDINECNTGNGNCSQLCNNTAGGSNCYCYDGYELYNGTYCEDINECNSDNGNCSQLCNNTAGGSNCNCYDGYELYNATYCEDINECNTGNGNCSQLCNNTAGGSNCYCYDGYELYNGTYCEDINECNTDNGNCSQLCNNTAGSSHCYCYDGYELYNATYCEDFDECLSNNGNCSQFCNNSFGGYVCSCYDGFQLIDNTYCQDINECNTDIGNCSQLCNNTAGSSNCYCYDGYELYNSTYCEDINECKSENGNCSQGCVNKDGSYECTCNMGYTLDSDGRICKDINECKTENGNCTQGCVNKDGSYECTCNVGYTLQSDGQACQDINECKSENANCSQGCVNKDGSYECTCNMGYTLDSDGRICKDINECKTENDNCTQGCVNKDGSYECTCNVGYTLESDGQTCQDIDECDNGNGNCKQICVNTSPGYHCSCNAGYGVLQNGLNCKVLFDLRSYGPNYGPTDGGTIVTLNGDLNILSTVRNVTLLKLDDNRNADSELKCEVIQWDRSSITFRTPFVNESFSGTNYSINVIYTTTQMETIDANTMKLFTYKPNPIITSIFPRKLFISGGIRLTAMGMFFDSIAQPVLIITVEKRLYDATKNTFTVQEKIEFQSQNTTVYNSTIIIGITPEISLSAIERKKRSTHNTSQVINNPNREIFVGFEMDGTETNKNLTQALGEDGRATFVHNPKVISKEEVIQYNPKTDPHIDIEGDRFLDGASASDFSVNIGNETCSILDVTNNQVLCKPPEKEPTAIQEGDRYLEGKPIVALFAGMRKYHIGHIDYTTEELIIIYSTVPVVGLLVILILAVVLIICIYQYGKKQKDSIERMSGSDSYLHPTRSYLQPQQLNRGLIHNFSRRPNNKLMRPSYVQSQPQNSGLHQHFLRRPNSQWIGPKVVQRPPTGIDNFLHYDNNFRKLVNK